MGSQKAVSFLGNFVELERKEIHLPLFPFEQTDRSSLYVIDQ
jgi:hypothetical protein